MICLHDAFLDESIGEGAPSFELQEDVPACVHVLGPFQVPWRGGSEATFESFALETDFQLCNFRSE